jgi:hypothetical protein
MPRWMFNPEHFVVLQFLPVSFAGHIIDGG